MMTEIGMKIKEINEHKQEIDDFKVIKPEGITNTKESQEFWNDIFKNSEIRNSNEEKIDALEEIEKTVESYLDELNCNSECPETIPENPIEIRDLEKLSPQEVAQKREEFDDTKAQLKKEWENEHGRPWPKYEQDVYSQNGKLIRRAGSDYDAHHIHPLSLGGKNEVKNITPLHAEVHYDRQGVHAPNSAYSKLDKIVGGIKND